MKKKIILSCLLASMLTTAAQASTISDIKYDVSTQVFSVSGNADANGDTTYREVSMLILAPGTTAADAAALTAYDRTVIEHYGQITPSANGSFSYSFKTSLPNIGSHRVLFTFADGESIEKEVFFTDVTANTNASSDLSGANDAAAMETVLDNYPYLLEGIDAYDEAANLMNDPAALKTDVAGKIAGLTFTNTADAYNEIKKAAAIAGLEEQSTADDFDDWLDKYKSDLGIEDDAIYTVLYNNSSDSVTNNLMTKEFASGTEFDTALRDSIILDAVNKSNNYTGIAYVLDNGGHYLTDADMSGYASLDGTQKVQVQNAVVGTYNSVDAFEAAVKTAVANAKNTVTEVTGGNGGGSYGGNVGMDTTIIAKNPDSTSVVDSLFGDLGSAEWARTSIEKLAKKGIISGTGENTFEPQENITREQFVKIITVAFGLVDENATVDCFDDVVKGSWYEKYVASAYNAGIIYGVGDNIFGVGMPITREDMAVIAARAAKLASYGTEDKFSDDDAISDYAKDAVYTMKQKGIMSGQGNNRFAPKSYATRAETAKMIDNMLGE